MQVIGPLNQRTAESFPIAGELYGWCSQVTAADLAPGSVGRGIFDAEARGDIPAGHGRAHHPPVPRRRRRHHRRGDRQHRRPVRGPPRPARAGPRGPRRWCRPRSTRSSASGRRSTPGVAVSPATSRSTATVVPAGAQVAILLRRRQPRPAPLRRPRRVPRRAQPGRPPLLRLRPARLRRPGARPPRGPRRSSTRWPGGSTGSSSARSAGSRSNITRSIDELPVLEVVAAHEDRAGPTPLRGPRPVRGGRARPDAPRRRRRPRHSTARRSTRATSPRPHGRRAGVPGRRAEAAHERRCAASSSSATASPGVTAADTLREAGFDGELTIVGDEPHPAYSRPALSKALLRDGTT